MAYIVSTWAQGGTHCQVSFRVKRDAFAVARMCCCVLGFPEGEIAKLMATRLGPEVPYAYIMSNTAQVRISRSDLQ